MLRVQDPATDKQQRQRCVPLAPPDTAQSHIRLLTDGAVCDNCRPRINELYQKQVRVHRFYFWGEILFTNSYSLHRR